HDAGLARGQLRHVRDHPPDRAPARACGAAAVRRVHDDRRRRRRRPRRHHRRPVTAPARRPPAAIRRARTRARSRPGEHRRCPRRARRHPGQPPGPRRGSGSHRRRPGRAPGRGPVSPPDPPADDPAPMTPPLFGEFLAAASEHIDAAVSFPGELPDRARPAAIWQPGRVISALARCAADVTPADDFDPAGPPPTAHEQAAAAPRLALLNAAEHAQLAARAGATGRADGGHPVVHHLSAAADHLAAGRDLLQTHLTAAGTGAGSPPWAPVITSPPAPPALIAELARYARRLAPWMSQLALARTPDPAVPAPACLALHTASGWLRAAGPVMVTAPPQHPQRGAGRRLPGA